MLPFFLGTRYARRDTYAKRLLSDVGTMGLACLDGYAKKYTFT